MSKSIRKLKALEDEKSNLQKRLQLLEQQSQQERKDLRLAQIHALGEAILSQLEHGHLGKEFFTSLPLRKAQTELFSDFFSNE
jgi:hypothetical protein